MNIEDIITEFGAYYLKQGQNMSRLVQQLYQPSVTDQVMTPFITDETIWRASETRFQRVLQPFQKAWTPIGNVQFIPVEIQQYKQKIDTEEYPDELEGSWLGFLAAGSLDRKEWPFIRWFIEVHLLPQAKQDYELSEVYEGVHRPIVSGQPGAAGTVITGLKYHINKGLLDNRTVPINTGALATDPVEFVDQIEDFVDAINHLYEDILMDLNLNKALAKRFMRGHHKKYGQDTNYQDNPKSKVKFSNITINGLPSMAASDKIWVTPKNNVIHLGKKTVNKNVVRIENVDRLVKMYSDWWSGVGFVIPEIIFTNDRDLGTPIITSFSGSPVAAGGQTVTVIGRHFNDLVAVKLNDTPVTSYEVSYAHGWKQLTFVSPAITAGAYPIKIENIFGETVSGANITVGA